MCEAPAVVMPADQSKKHVILQVCRGWLGICSLRVLLHWPWCWAMPADAGMEHLQCLQYILQCFGSGRYTSLSTLRFSGRN